MDIRRCYTQTLSRSPPWSFGPTVNTSSALYKTACPLSASPAIHPFDSGRRVFVMIGLPNAEKTGGAEPYSIASPSWGRGVEFYSHQSI